MEDLGGTRLRWREFGGLRLGCRELGGSWLKGGGSSGAPGWDRGSWAAPCHERKNRQFQLGRRKFRCSKAGTEGALWFLAGRMDVSE